jgi:hypothetical protein
MLDVPPTSWLLALGTRLVILRKMHPPPDSSSDATAAIATPVEGKRPWRMRLLLAFCCFHAVFLICSIYPPGPVDKPGNPALDFYRVVFVGIEQWNMFETIPSLHSMDVRLEGQNDRGETVTKGSILPGFKRYPQPERVRYFNSLLRVVSNERQLASYLQKLARALPPRQGPEDGKDWALVVDAEYTRHLFHVARDGQVSIFATKAFELPKPGEDSPPPE